MARNSWMLVASFSLTLALAATLPACSNSSPGQNDAGPDAAVDVRPDLPPVIHPDASDMPEDVAMDQGPPVDHPNVDVNGNGGMNAVSMGFEGGGGIGAVLGAAFGGGSGGPPPDGGTGASDCQACAQMANGQTCASQVRACQQNMDCDQIAACTFNCMDDACLTACQDMYPAGKDAFLAFEMCVVNACRAHCGAADGGTSDM
jgi:hypothetical protein